MASGEEPITTLERGEVEWTILERDGYPADLNKIRHALLSLAETQILEAKTADPAFHDRLGVEAIAADTAGGIEVRLIGPAEPVEVIVGNTAGEYRRYVRRKNENQTYLINRDPEFGATLTDWLDTTIVDVDSQRIRQVTVSHTDGETLIVSKDVRGQPSFSVENVPEERELRYDSIANVMGSVLDGLTLEDVERLTDTTAEVVETEFRTFDGLVIKTHALERGEEGWVSFAATVDPTLPEEEVSEEMRVAAEAEAARINARLQGWQYRISTSKFDQLTRGMADLLQDSDG